MCSQSDECVPVVLGTLERDELFYFFGMAKNLVFHRKVVLHRSLD